MDRFDRQLEAARAHILDLHRRAGEAPQSDLLAEALEELSATLEELQASEEELIQQNEELAAAYQALEVEGRRYQDLFENAPDAYLLTDEIGMIREANRAAAAMFNIPQPSLIRQPLFSFVVKEERPAFLAGLNRLRKMPSRQEWESRLQPRTSAPLDVDLRVAPVQDQAGGPLLSAGCCAILRRVSGPRKRFTS